MSPVGMLPDPTVRLGRQFVKKGNTKTEHC